MVHAFIRDNGSCLFIFFSIFMFSFVLFTIWSTTHTIYNTKGSRVTDTLTFVIVVSRHGNRGPMMDIPNDPYPSNDTTLWPYGKEELTPYGRVQMYNLGVTVRALYDGFINKTYNRNEFYASSTAMERTLISGEAFLDGFYPPTYEDKRFPSQLIPLYSNSPDKTPVTKYCTRLMRRRNKTVEVFEQENAVLLKGLNEYLKEYSEMVVTGTFGLYALMDTIICQTTEGFTLTPWIQQIFPHPLSDVASQFFIEFVAGNNELVKLTVGDFYEELVGVMKSKVGGTLSPDRKMYFYSGHDHTLIALQAMLGIPKSSIIGMVLPGSGMLFELHQEPNTKEFYIEVLYIDGGSQDLTPQHLPIPNCNFDGSKCEFHKLVKDIQLKYSNVPSYNEECQESNGMNDQSI